VTLLNDGQELPKDHTVFIKAYRLGSRSLYLRSFACKIMKMKGRSPRGDQDHDDPQIFSPPKGNEPSTGPSSPS